MEENTGFIVLHRKMLEWEWYSDINTKVLFIHLLLKANYKVTRFQGKEILRGQYLTSTASLALQTGLTERQVRVSLDKLKMTGEITSTIYPRYRIITINKYNDYQDKDSQNDSQMTGEMSPSCQADDRAMTSSCQGNDRVMTTCKQSNNSNKVTKQQSNNKDLSLIGFDLFWENYPKKIGKPNAMKAFKKIHPDDELLSTMLAAIVKQKATAQWQEADGQYIPYPATWLNNRRWEDEVKPASQSKPKDKTVPAQAYEQRDYSEAGTQSLEEQMAWINQMNAEGWT